VLNAERAWVEPDQVANAWTTERLSAWAQAKPLGGNSREIAATS
jgi:hypothetical protein